MSIQIKQYPRTLETNGGNCNHYYLAWRTGILLLSQSPFLGRSLGPLSLMSLIPPEKQVYTVLGLKNMFFQLPIGRGELTHLCFGMDRLSRRLQCATYLDQCAPGLKDTKCRLPAFLHRFPEKTVPETHRPWTSKYQLRKPNFVHHRLPILVTSE